MDYKYNFSFIIPHKNNPDLLRRCVMSIPKRNDVQIIIVDDDSDADKVDFEHFPFLGTPNVKIIFDKSGLRQGHARNIGLEHAEGKWIIFADSDDFFFYSINKAMDDSLMSNSDIIYYKSTNLDSNTYQVIGTRSCITNNSIELFVAGNNNGEHFVRFRHPAPWGKLIRSSLIKEHNIKFPEIIKAEDFEFSYKCGYYAKKVEAYDLSIYCLTSRTGNLTSITETADVKMSILKNETDFLKFMAIRDLAKTPVYNIIEQDVFSHLYDIKKINSSLYFKATSYILECGFPDRYINDNVNRIKRKKLNTKIVKYLPKCLLNILKK